MRKLSRFSRRRYGGKKSLAAGAHNSFIISEFSPEEDSVWKTADSGIKRQFFDYAKTIAEDLFKRQILAGIGANGEKLIKVLPSNRPDHATGPPLVPHIRDSRAYKRLRVSINYKQETLTFRWTGDWGLIIGYHAAGMVPHAPVRDILGLSPFNEKYFHDKINHWWRLHRPQHPFVAIKRFLNTGKVTLPAARTPAAQRTQRTQPTKKRA